MCGRERKMREALYFELRKRINSDFICILITEIAMVLYYARYLIRRSFMRRNSMEQITKQDALQIISNCFPYIDEDTDIVIQKTNREMDCSVILPIFNHEDVVDKTLSSVFNQKTKHQYEIIIVDDGSNEETKRIIEKYRDYKNCSIITQENSGVAASRNVGLNHAVGKYVMFVDGDDILDPDAIETLLDVAIKENVDMVAGGYSLDKVRGDSLISRKEYVYPSFYQRCRSAENDIMFIPGHPVAKVYRRSLFDDIRFFPKYWYEDSIIHFLVFRKCKSFVYVPKVIYRYRWHDTNFSKLHASDPRIVQRYWMLLRMIETSIKINLPMDETFYITLLKHLTAYYYINVKTMNKEAREAMFILACDLLKQFKGIKKVKMPFVLRDAEKALLNRDYNLYCLACANM